MQLTMKRYFTLINVLLITAAVYFGVNMFYKLSTASLDRAQISETAMNTGSAFQDEPIRPLNDYNPIIERNLFNTKKDAGSQPKMLDIENLKPTSLNLKLLGTVTGDRDTAYAVIQDTSQNRHDLYKTGDTIQNAILKLILREKVILQVNGKDEILEIEDVAASQQTDRRHPGLHRATARNITLNRSQIESAVKNINTLMQQVRVRPHFTNGKPDGLSLTQIKPNSIFQRMGIRSGDVITGVDGKSIESVDDALKLYRSLQSSSSVKLQLKRRGRLKTIDYDIK